MFKRFRRKKKEPRQWFSYWRMNDVLAILPKPEKQPKPKPGWFSWWRMNRAIKVCERGF